MREEQKESRSKERKQREERESRGNERGRAEIRERQQREKAVTLVSVFVYFQMSKIKMDKELNNLNTSLGTTWYISTCLTVAGHFKQ